MPRHSRGCKECRQRRIGCDLEWPFCRQCRITNRHCSGPVRQTQHIFIDQTRTAAKGRSTPDKQRREPPGCSDSDAVQDRPLVLLYDAPSAAPAASAAYTSHFMRFLTPVNNRRHSQGLPQRSWLHNVWASPECSPDSALDLSLRAAAAAYCGVTLEERNLVREACRLYGTALSRQSAAIGRGGGVPDLAAFGTTVALAVFETVWSTGNAALTSHLAAARRMLCLASPELAQNGLFQDLSLFVQYQTLFAMIVSPADYQATTAGRVSWSDMSHFYSHCETTVMDDLMLQLFRLGELFTRRESGGRHPQVDFLACDEIEREVDLLWARHRSESVGCVSSTSAPSEKDDEHHQHVVNHRQTDTSLYADPLTAITDIYFAATRFLRSLVATGGVWRPRPAGGHGRQDASVEPCSQIILDCASFLRTAPIGCIMLRMFFPLALVALYSTSEGQRREAGLLLNGWLHISAFGGLCKIVQRRIDIIISS